MSPPVRLLKTVRLLETLEYSLIYFQVQLFPVPYFIPEFQHNNFVAFLPCIKKLQIKFSET